MGDLITSCVDGTLYFIGTDQFHRIKQLNLSKSEHAALFADMARLNVLYMIARAGSGHIGSSFSSMEILTHLQLIEMQAHREDVFFSSKGHDAPALYAILIASGIIEENMLHNLRRLDGLPGHPDIAMPGIVTNTGSLGMGISKAKGVILAKRLSGARCNVVVLTGDGELQEGQIWESLIGATNRRMAELTVVVDCNKIQSDYSVRRTSALGDIAEKFRAFGWHAVRIDGHDTEVLDSTFRGLEKIVDRPKVIIADTVKGKGVSFMEGRAFDSDIEAYGFHSGAPTREAYRRATQEIIDRINSRLAVASRGIEVESMQVEPLQLGAAYDALIPAYSEALMAAAESRPALVALDADLAKDMGLLPFASRYPERFFECGIAEQDMVSMAGGLALFGHIPVVHSFSCFLTTRANEQIYNNATEGTRIVYVGGLSGVLPASPGHSHQSVREISAIGGIPNLVMVAPSCSAEVAPLLTWCLDNQSGPSFLRLVSLPARRQFSLPQGYRPELGRGTSFREGGDVVLIGAGPTVLSEGCEAARLLAGEGIDAAVINLPWLNRIDSSWLDSVLDGKRLVVTLDDHYVNGGQGERILAAISLLGRSIPTLQIGLLDKPPCGQPREVLSRVGLSSDRIARTVLEKFRTFRRTI